MNSWPTLKQWCEFGGTLLLELLILFAVAKLISVRLHSAQWRRCIWQMVVVAMFLVVAGELNGVRGLIRLPHKAPVVVPTRAVVVTIKNADLPMETPPLLTFAPSPPITPEPVKSISRWQRHVSWPALAWCGVTALLLSRILVAQVMTITFRLPRGRKTESEVNSRVARIAELFRIRRRVVIANSARAIAPFTFGVWRPVIVLPINFEETFTPEQQDAALVHELAHVARFDSAWRAFSHFVCALLWWNPFVWISKRELDHASELVADESSLLLADGPNRLAECLIACAKQARRPIEIAWLGMDGGGFRSALGKRVARLLQLNPRRTATARVPWCLRIVAPAICSLALWVALGVATKHFDEQPIATWRGSIIGNAFGALAESAKGEVPPASAKGEGKRLLEVEQQWAEPVARTNNLRTSKARQEIYDRLRSTRLSEWGPMDNLPLHEVIRRLSDEMIRRDPGHKGVSFIISPSVRSGTGVDPAGLPTVTMSEPTDLKAATVHLGAQLRDPSVEEVLNILTMITKPKIKYSVEDYFVIISAQDVEPPTLQTRFFKVDPNAFQQGLQLIQGQIGTNLFPRTGFATNRAGGISFPLDASDTSPPAGVIPTVQNWFRSLGVDLTIQNKAVFFNDRLGVIMVRATPQDLDTIEKAIQFLNMSPPQLEIRVKVMEVIAERATETFLQFGITNAQTPAASSPPGGSNRPLPTLSGILTEPQFQSVLRAMEKIGGTDLLSAPTVTTMSGRQAQIKVVDIKYIVTDLGYNANSAPDKPEIMPIAEPFEIGPTVDVVPYVLGDGYTIQMTVLPTLREFLGYEDPASHALPDAKFKGLTQPTPLPKFRLRQVATSACVWDGQTLVLGAGTARTMQKDRDANGIITTSYTDKALFFFITPRLIDPAGNPLHSGEELHEVHKTVPEQKQIPQR